MTLLISLNKNYSCTWLYKMEKPVLFMNFSMHACSLHILFYMQGCLPVHAPFRNPIRIKAGISIHKLFSGPYMQPITLLISMPALYIIKYIDNP